MIVYAVLILVQVKLVLVIVIIIILLLLGVKMNVGDSVLAPKGVSGKIVELKEIVYPFGNYFLVRIRDKRTRRKSSWINLKYCRKI